MGGGAGVVMMAEADGFGLEGCDLLLLKHLTDELMHLDRHLLSRLKVKEMEEEKLDHSEDFDLLRLMRLSSVNVVTSPNSMKMENDNSPHVHRALPSRPLDLSRPKGDCDSETDVVSLRIDSEKDGPGDKDTSGHGQGFFSVPLLVVVVVARVIHFVVNFFCDKIVQERGRRYEDAKVFVGKKGNGNEAKSDTGIFETKLNVLSSFKLKESVLQLPDQSNKKKNKSNQVGVEVASVFIAVASVFELIMGTKHNHKKRRSVGKHAMPPYPRNAFVLLLLAVSFKCFVDASDSFVWTAGYKDNFHYKDYCYAEGDDNTHHSCVCLTENTYTRPSSGAGSTGYSYYKCTEKCDGYPHKANGYCGQCAAGYFFGTYYKGGYDTECSGPNPDLNECICGITTYSQQNVEENFDFYFTCSHNAKDWDVNKVDYEDGYCNECPVGTYSNQGDMVCSACLVGTYTDTAGTPKSCNQCPAGTYTDKTGTTECTHCPAGTSTNNTVGSTTEADCLKCHPGYYSSSPGSKECTRCGAGTYTDTYGATSCKQADPGHYVGSTNTVNAHTAQYVCPVGSYAEKQEGSSKCISCPIGKSTNDVGSTSLSDCIECPYGVDSHTYACLTQTEATSMTNLCWDAGQLLGMNASSAVQDLYSLVYSLQENGMNDVISNTMSFIEQVANGGVSSFESMNSGVSALLDQLQNAPNLWLEGASDSYQNCINETSSRIDGTVTSASALYYNTDMFSYQFGSNFKSIREKWIAHWKCNGATFGCVNSGNHPCPVVAQCFKALSISFASLLTGPGGATFGNYPASNMGRYTPEYGPTYFKTELSSNVKSLANWENTKRTFALYESVIKEIRQMGNEIIGFTVEATDAILQVESVETAANLATSLNSGT